MPTKAPRIPDEIWSQHQEEIINFYSAPNSLKLTMDYMAEKWDFRASENQYTAKLKSWGVRKYIPESDWVSVACKKRKRAQEGKESDFTFYGHKYSRQKVNKEIARHVSSRTICSGLEFAALPDHITVSTPPGELIGIPREYFLRNLPWYQYKQEIQTLFSVALQSSVIQPTLDTSLVPATRALSSVVESDLPQLCTTVALPSEIHSFLPPENPEITSTSTRGLGSQEKKSPLSIVQAFLCRFVFLSSNNLLDQSHFNEVCDWVTGKTGGADFLVRLCRLGPPSMKVLARKVLVRAIESRNLPLATKVAQCVTQLQDDLHRDQIWAGYLSDAVLHGDVAMVELLCNMGIPPTVYAKAGSLLIHKWESLCPSLGVLLTFGAHPESFITNQEPGFPLVDAARDGSLRAVEMLVNAGARVDFYLPSWFGTALQAAVSEGHIEVARYLIQSGADVNVPGAQIPRIRHCSIVDRDKMDLVAFRLDQMTPLQTPIQLATKNSSLDLVKLLLNYGARVVDCPVSAHPDFENFCRVEATGSNRHWPGQNMRWFEKARTVYTPLQYGVRNQNSDIVAVLLSAGVPPDSRVAPCVGDTPLQISARLGNVELFEILLRSGADVNAPPAGLNGRTAAQGAAESGTWEILGLLRNAGAQFNAPAGPKLGMTALQAACLNGHSVIAGFLLAHGANLDAAPSQVAGLTPVQAAATYGDVGAVKNLIDLGAEVNAPATEMGTNALCAAIKHRSLPLLRLLVRHGANVNPLRDCPLRSPLEEAAKLNWFNGAKLLLEHGASLDDTPFELATSDEYVNTSPELLSPLGWAIRNHSAEMIGVLLKMGADVAATARYNGSTPEKALIFALRRQSRLPVLSLLFAKVQDLETYPGWEDALQAVLENWTGSSLRFYELVIKKTSSLSESLRQKVIQRGWHRLPPSNGHGEVQIVLKLIERLLNSGADINSHRADGSTLLHRMVRKDCHKTCCFLLSRGATVNTQRTQYWGTPLQEAIKEGNAEIANLFLENGADVNALPAEKRGVTALQAASINGMFETTLRLLECGADVSAPAAPEDGRTAIDGAAERGYFDMGQLLLNAYGEREDLGTVCKQAADYAENEGHDELAEWLRRYSVP